MPVEIPLWRLKLSYDFRQLMQWGLDNFPPVKGDEVEIVIRTAINDKSPEIMVDRAQIAYLDNMASAAFGTDDAVRIDAGRFLDVLTAMGKRNPDGIVSSKKSDRATQQTMFD